MCLQCACAEELYPFVLAELVRELELLAGGGGVVEDVLAEFVDRAGLQEGHAEWRQ